jgi:uncharacterized protein (UPF0264 family)
MQLLVSVANADDARAALEGGADVIDAKEPARGPLGAVAPDVFATIADAVAGVRPLSAALGEPGSDHEAARLAAAFAAAGATFVKIGFAHDMSTNAIARRLLAVREVAPAQVIAVACADTGSDVVPMRVAEAALSSGAAGVLLDTADKNGPGLCRLRSLDAIASWATTLTTRGLFVALAGKLTLDDVVTLRGVGCHLVGVRGAACDGGRNGRVVAARVQLLKAACAVSEQYSPVRYV